MKYFAHTTPHEKETWQPLTEHLKNVAELAKNRADIFGAGEYAYWAGLLHDVGKFSQKFQTYLETGQGRVDHSTAGGQLVSQLWKNEKGPKQEALAMLLSYVIAGHHGGLPDGGTTTLDAGTLLARLSKQDLPSYEAWKEYIELSSIPSLPKLRITKETAAFTLSFFVRMLYSCLTDGDYLDTEKFCDISMASARGDWPTIDDMSEKLNKYLGQIIEEAKDTRINSARLDILNHCQQASKERSGVFSLTVPTGGGKTLSSLSFALKHAQRHSLRRVIYVIPYTSIIEQNADVFRKALGNDAVLEHHCNYVHPAENIENSDEHIDAEDARRFRLATENWDATLIVTTAVQFFESLFANRSSRCRKLHNIAQSVVILDEAQMLPLNLLQPTVMALRELVDNYGTTLVLCTATQPALTRSGKLQHGFRDGDIREIIPNREKKQLFETFSRSQVKHIGTLSDKELADRLISENQVLCIVNTRNNARDVFNALKSDEANFHLSARMYPKHRRDVLEIIRQRLSDGKPCRVVSTSLIECGVDVDFPVVYRATAGLDSIAQAAGRCNREGALGTGIVYVFYPEKGMPKRAPGFQRRAEVFQEIGETYDELFSPEAVKAFFISLYKYEELDRGNIMSSLINANKGLPFPNLYPFAKIASSYRFIENNMVSVIVERGEEASSLVQQLEYSNEIKGVLRQLQGYTVQVYFYELDAFLLGGGVELIRNQFYVARGGMGYRADIGLCSDDPAHWEAGEGII